MGAAPQVEPLGISVAAVLNAKNHFEVIGLEPKRCCGADLRSAYKKTALKVHPDKCEDSRAIEAFRRLQEAFKVLSDPMLHARYAQQLQAAQTRMAAGRAHARSAAYASRARVSKEELERQVKEMMARQNKQRPMATGQAAQKAAEERVARERERQQKLEREEKQRQADAVKRREQAEKALNSARNRTPRTPKGPRPCAEEPPPDPEALKQAQERARRRAASMGFLSDQMGWAKATSREPEQPPQQESSRQSQGTPRSGRRPSSARSPPSSPFGDLRSLRRAQTERAAKRPVPPSSYLPRFMREKTTVTVIKV